MARGGAAWMGAARSAYRHRYAIPISIYGRRAVIAVRRIPPAGVDGLGRRTQRQGRRSRRRRSRILWRLLCPPTSSVSA